MMRWARSRSLAPNNRPVQWDLACWTCYAGIGNRNCTERLPGRMREPQLTLRRLGAVHLGKSTDLNMHPYIHIICIYASYMQVRPPWASWIRERANFIVTLAQFSVHDMSNVPGPRCCYIACEREGLSAVAYHSACVQLHLRCLQRNIQLLPGAG